MTRSWKLRSWVASVLGYQRIEPAEVAVFSPGAVWQVADIAEETAASGDTASTPIVLQATPRSRPSALAERLVHAAPAGANFSR